MRKQFKILTIAGLLCLAPGAFAGSVVDELIALNAPGGASEGQFDSLIAAVTAADLIPTLTNLEEATVFAPTDAAFEALGLSQQVIDIIPPQILAMILTYHVASQTLLGTDLSASRITPVKMVNEGTAYVTNVRRMVNEGTLPNNGLRSLKINRANITQTDVIADNGVIHVIDAVLIPVLGVQPQPR